MFYSFISTSYLFLRQNDLLKSTWRNNTNHFRIWIQDLKSVCCVLGHRSIITRNQDPSFLITIFLSPELESTTKVEEILIMGSMLVREYAQIGRSRSVCTDQSERIV